MKVDIEIGDGLLCIMGGTPNDKFTVGKMYTLEHVASSNRWPCQICNDLDKMIQFSYYDIIGMPDPNDDEGTNIPLFYPIKLVQDKDKFIFHFKMTGKLPHENT